MSQRPPMAGPGDWGMPRSNAGPVAGQGHPSMGRSGPMGGPMINRSNSVPANPRSMLQQQLMDMGMLHVSVVVCKIHGCMCLWQVIVIIVYTKCSAS